MTELLHWWNLVYVLAFSFALLYVTLSALGLDSHGADAEADHDVDLGHDVDLHHELDAHVDMDHDLDAHVDVDAHAEVDAHVDVDHDLDVHAEAGEVVAHADADHGVHVDAAHAHPSLLQEALSFFGVGKVPLSVVLMCFLLTFAVVGWSANLLLKGVVPGGGLMFLISCPAAVVCGVGATKLLARTVGRWLRPMETAAVRRSSLVGRVGTTCLPVTREFGQALVRDEHGTMHKVVCKTQEDGDDIPKGETVLLVRYVARREPGKRASGHYTVMPFDVPDV